MLNPITFARKPEYFFHPSQALHRFRRLWHNTKAEEIVRLPWGALVRVNTAENVGIDIYQYGIFDKIVPETIWRLLDAGETGVDVGANIGQNSSAMAFRSGPSGRVIAFEPPPEIFGEVRTNVGRWPASLTTCLQLENVALGTTDGEACLADGPEFQHNRGSAAICKPASATGRTFKVRLRKLDNYVTESTTVGVCKIDVEGHELDVLEGAKKTLERKGIRDIIFEDFKAQPSPVTQLLRHHGFDIFRLVERWLKPVILPLETSPESGGFFSYNYLATLNPQRAANRFRTPGWRCLMHF